MSSVDKDTNVLDNKKEAVVPTPLTEKKVLTNEKVATSDEVNKRTEKITTSEEVVKGNDEVHKRNENITTNEEVDKDNEKLEDTKEVVVTICKKDSDKFVGQSKGYTGWFNIDHELKKEKFPHLNHNYIKTL